MARKYAFRLFVFLIMLVLVSLGVFAVNDRYFSIRDNGSPFTVPPGEVFYVDFVLANIGYVSPRNVTVFLSPCPDGWVCESKTYSYHESGEHNESLRLLVPPTANQKKYTMYFVLSSEEFTKNGDDRVVISVLDSDLINVKSYAEYLETKDSYAARREEMLSQRNAALIKDTKQNITQNRSNDSVKLSENMVVSDVTVDTEHLADSYSKFSGVGERVERLESDSQFIEYVTAVLMVLLVLIIVGLLNSYRSGKKAKAKKRD